MTGTSKNENALFDFDCSKNPMNLPSRIDDDGLLVAWSLEHEHKPQPIGFRYGNGDQSADVGCLDPILFDDDGHLMTFAPAGAGKGTGCIVPTLLRHKGQIVVIDPRGEAYAVTAHRRRELGHKIIVLDPAGFSEGPRDTFNPFDILDLDSATALEEIAALTDLLWPDEQSPDDPFWQSSGKQFLLGVILHLLYDKPASQNTFAEVRRIVGQAVNDPAGVLGAMLQSRHPEARHIANMLQLPAAEILSGIISFAHQGLSLFRGELVQEATARTSFDLSAFEDGDLLSLYLIMPPHLLESHRGLLRIWISALMMAAERKQERGTHASLFLLDHAAQLGVLPKLRQAITLMRGYGLQTWSFWQDVQQFTSLYPDDWQTMTNNCSVIQAFGAKTLRAAKDMSELTSFGNARNTLGMDYDEMLLAITGDETVVAQRVNYLTDPIFKGLWESNPLHEQQSAAPPQPRHPKRFYIRPRAELLQKLISDDDTLLDGLIKKWDA